MGYCTLCGAEYSNDSSFCKNCGTKIVLDSKNTNLPEDQTHKNNHGGSKHKKKIIAFVSLILCGALMCGLLFNLISIPNGLKVEYSEQGISRFLKKVCKKVDGKAELASSDSDSPGNMYGQCYIPVVTVKRSGKVAEEIPLRFFNSGSSDTVSSVTMILYSFDTRGFSAKDYENIFECEKALLIGLEKTVAGKSYVADYLTTYWEVCTEVFKGKKNEKVVLVTYELSNDLTVVIETENGGNAWGDRVYYTLQKKSSW